MGKPKRATQGKRDRERLQKDRQQEREQQKAARKEARAERLASIEQGIDPDLLDMYVAEP